MRVSIPPDVVFRELEDEAIIVDLRTQEYFGLDQVGTRIWSLLDEYGDVDSAIDVMFEEYEVSREQLRLDVDEFLMQLRAASLIEVRPPEPPHG